MLSPVPCAFSWMRQEGGWALRGGCWGIWMSRTQCSLFFNGEPNSKEITKTLWGKIEGERELVRSQSVFRLNRFPLQTSYIPFCPMPIDLHRPCLASSNFALAPASLSITFVLPSAHIPTVFCWWSLFFTVSCYSSPIVNAQFLYSNALLGNAIKNYYHILAVGWKSIDENWWAHLLEIKILEFNATHEYGDF